MRFSTAKLNKHFNTTQTEALLKAHKENHPIKAKQINLRVRSSILLYSRLLHVDDFHRVESNRVVSLLSDGEALLYP
jgi:hypothetical protein